MYESYSKLCPSPAVCGKYLDIACNQDFFSILGKQSHVFCLVQMLIYNLAVMPAPLGLALPKVLPEYWTVDKKNRLTKEMCMYESMKINDLLL